MNEAHYVSQNGTHQPATVTQVHDKWSGVANLAVTPLPEGAEREAPFEATSIEYSSEQQPGTWHWAVQCKAQRKAEGRTA